MRALTFTRPWGWAILNAGKDVENRRQQLHNHRGVIAIHVGKLIDDGMVLPPGIKLPDAAYENEGMIIGTAELVDVIARADLPAKRSKWYNNAPYAYVLRNPRLLRTPLKCRGSQGLWNVPPEVARRFRYQIQVR